MREAELDLDRLAQTESVFALSNGHIGLRGNLDEGGMTPASNQPKLGAASVNTAGGVCCLKGAGRDGCWLVSRAAR